MAYFRKIAKLDALLNLLVRNERWLIVINADPDAIASAYALRRIMQRSVGHVDIAKINAITRPDNLTFIQYLRLPLLDFTPEMISQYDHFAMVDSQPHHSELFPQVSYSIVIDHHPLPEVPAQATFFEVLPEYGATSTMLTEYLYNLDIRPGKLLATALQFGIKTDTGSFERNFCDIDLRAYRYLGKFSDKAQLTRIVRSEFRLAWLPHFAAACHAFSPLRTGRYSYVGLIDNPDILVVIADFFMRVYGVRWVAVAGVYKDKVVVVFRGDGILRDIGLLAQHAFGDIGSAGGHKTMARAEFSVSALEGKEADSFIRKRLQKPPRKGVPLVEEK